METAKAQGERALFQRFQLLRQHLYASPSGVSYANSTPSMVQVSLFLRCFLAVCAFSTHNFTNVSYCYLSTQFQRVSQVFEPPHRPDVPDTGFAALTGRFWSVPAEQRGEFTAKLDALLKEFNA